MDEREIKLRCIEAAARTPTVHLKGQAEGVVEIASAWFDWIISSPKGEANKPLGLPGKKQHTAWYTCCMEVCADKVKAPAMQKSSWPPWFGTSRRSPARLDKLT